MAAIRHKLSARPSSGTPSAFSTRGVVVLLKTFASNTPSRFRPQSQGRTLYAGRSPCIPNGPISHKQAVGVSVRKELQCRDSGFVQSVCRRVAFWAIAGLLESKRPPTWGLWFAASALEIVCSRRRWEDFGDYAAQRSCNVIILQPRVAVSITLRC
jgi:hypothetical protein